MIDFTKFDNLISLVSYFSSNDKCKKAIIESRWTDGDVICPFCGEHHCATRKDGRFRCKSCGRNFSCLVGTVFENTNLPLIKWFVAMYLISSHKKGISSYQLAKDIKVTQSTAWYMLQKIRLLYPQTNEDTFGGVVECDEVYIGGKEKWKHRSMRTPHTQGRSTKTKTPVFGMMERSILVNDNDVSDEHLQSYINEAVYRWNTRKLRGSDRFAQMFAMSIGIVRRWNEIKVGLIAA